MNDSEVVYSARARLISMRAVVSAYTGNPVTLQTWEITGVGSIAGAAASAIEVSTVMEHETRPAFTYAAFAVHDGCDALVFSGGSETSSYDSTTLTTGSAPPEDAYGADVGTNGNLNTNGVPTNINGTLSTPRTGLGNCTNSAITAATLDENTDVDALIQLPQAVSFPTPDAPSPTPPTTSVDFTGPSTSSGRGGGSGTSTPTCPADLVAAIDAAATASNAPAGSYGCTATQVVVGGTTINRYVLDPPPNGTVTLGNVTANSANTEIHLKAGNFNVNSLTVTGNASLIVDDGPVRINVHGKHTNGNDLQNVVDLEGSADVITPNYDPSMLQFIYAGESHVRVRGGATAALLVYAPNADVELAGQADYYGAIVGKYVRVTGGAEVHYDRNLSRSPARSAAEWTLSGFTWRAF